MTDDKLDRATIYVRWSDDGRHIRKFDFEPFDGCETYSLTPREPNDDLERVRKDLGISDDNMIADDWLIRQLAAWPTRIHPDKTKNCRFLMESAALTLRLAAIGAMGVGDGSDHNGDTNNMIIEERPDSKGRFDELVITNPDTVHIEMLDTGHCYIGVYRGPKSEHGLQIWMRCKGKLEVTHKEYRDRSPSIPIGEDNLS